MSTELPLKIRVEIRDQWDSPTGLVQRSVDTLAKSLGHRIMPQVTWPQFYGVLKEAYADKSTFVPTVVRVVVLFYDLLVARLEREGVSEWTDQLLEEMAKKPVGWLLRIEAYNGSRPRVTLKADVGEFSLEIPTRELPMSASIQAGFDQDLDQLFSSPMPITEEHDDERAEVLPAGETKELPQPQDQGTLSVQNTVLAKELPALERLARPVDLFKTTVPYILRVDARTSPLVVQCSHQPSLDLLVSYLKKWAKENPQDSLKRSVLKITPKESDFVFGIIDRVEIELQVGDRSTKPLNPAILLAFVEGVLGYNETHTTGCIWTFKSETFLK